MKSHEIREAFIEYFSRNGHTPVASSRLVPDSDPTLLFNNAGMNQFKNVFTGLETRKFSRAVSSQKCVRAGGKHNDLENVGHTARHHTFFEMLGNFSFGDYFKKEAIHFAWEFLTKELNIPKDKLYVTVFETDDEAANIWEKQEGVPKDRIFRFGEKDNFWRMGTTGPCGPCSEIFYDFGPDVGGNPKDNVVGGDGDRYVGIWNLVFMQYFEDESGKQTPLPKPSIDTGAGLERLCTVLQGKLNNYDTDVFQEIIAKASQLSAETYQPEVANSKTNTNFRVLADHARSAAFLIGDGVLPSNEGRGYVLRRIMRRAIKYGKNLTEKSLLPHLVQVVIDKMGDQYPELKERQDIIVINTQDEETRFLKTLDQGTEILNEELKKLKLKNKNTLSGKALFKLYDTFGFPADLTRIMAEEQGFEVDELQFEVLMDEAKQKAKASWKGAALDADQALVIKTAQEILKSTGATDFTGHSNFTEQGQVLRLSDGKQIVDTLKQGQSGYIILDKTCFYAEGGGQSGDVGTIESAHGKANVINCLNQSDVHILYVLIEAGEINVGDMISQNLSPLERQSTANNHSATHLLHSALREILGEHIQQAGSLVEPKRLRFDYTHNSPLSNEDIINIENFVNNEIDRACIVETKTMTADEAKNQGAMALFGEKYGDSVRVVTMGPFSMELCGGTHVQNTAQIGLFKIVSEAGVSSGVRRIEAITGSAARRFVLKNTRENLETKSISGLQQGWSEYMDSNDTYALATWAQSQKDKIKSLEKEVQQLKSKGTDVSQFLDNAISFEKNGQKGTLVLADLPVDDRKVLSDLSDKLRDKAQPAVVIVVGKGDKTNPVIVTVSKGLSKSVNAGQMLKEVAQIMGGKGGGRPDFAQGSAPDRSQLKLAFKKAKEIVQ